MTARSPRAERFELGRDASPIIPMPSPRPADSISDGCSEPLQRRADSRPVADPGVVVETIVTVTCPVALALVSKIRTIFPQVLAPVCLGRFPAQGTPANGTGFALNRIRRHEGLNRLPPPDRHGPFTGHLCMSDRTNTLLWMRDLIEHMRHCQEQLQWASDGPSESFLTEAMLVDLSECRTLCERLRSKHTPHSARMHATSA